MKTYPIFKRASGNGLLNNLISVWGLDETSGTTMYDSHGSNDGTTTAGVDINQTGKLDKSYYFNANTDYSVVPHSTTLTPTGDITFAAWVKSATPVTDSFGCILSKDNVTDNRQFTFAMYARKAYLYFYTSDSTFSARISAASVQSSTEGAAVWVHIIATVTVSTGVINFYINGSLSNGTQTSTSAGNMNSGTDDLWLGNRSYGLDMGFTAWMDQVAMWNKILSADERAALYNSGNGLAYTNWTT